MLQAYKRDVVLYSWPCETFVIIKHFFHIYFFVIHHLLLNYSTCSSCSSNGINGVMFLPSISTSLHRITLKMGHSCFPFMFIHISFMPCHSLLNVFQGPTFIGCLDMKLAQMKTSNLWHRLGALWWAYYGQLWILLYIKSKMFHHIWSEIPTP